MISFRVIKSKQKEMAIISTKNYEHVDKKKRKNDL